jgi:hypothetical protein
VEKFARRFGINKRLSLRVGRHGSLPVVSFP